MFYLSDVELNNFRCYDCFLSTFSSNINVIVGKNAIGKTSLIEGIYYLGLCKSFKTNDYNELLKKDKDYLYVKGTLVDGEKEYKIVASMTDKGKKISVNNTIYRSLSDYLGFLNIICFSPEDLKLVKGEPKIKRRFLDINIGQKDKIYLKHVIDYNKVLKERNELLKNDDIYPQFNDLLKVYTEKLATIGYEIIKRRREFLKDIEPFINKKIKEISSDDEEVEICYKPNVSEDDIKNELFKAIEVDKYAKTTTIGPHRDDVVLNINGYNASIYGSQGQQRTIALAIKLGLADYIKKDNDKLIIILDDVFGELDNKRQIELLRSVMSENQVFITTTSCDNIDQSIINDCNVIKLEEKVI